MSTPDRVKDLLLEEILELRLTPGTPLREVALAERFGVSRRSVREAVRELERIGVTEVRYNAGGFVRVMTESDVREMYIVRRVLEGTAAAQCATASDAELDHVREALSRLERAARANLDSSEHALADMSFHGAVIALLRSARLDQVFADLGVSMAYAIRVLQRDESDQNLTAADVLSDHHDIARAIFERSHERAQAAVLRHIEANETRLLHLVKTTGAHQDSEDTPSSDAGP